MEPRSERNNFKEVETRAKRNRDILITLRVLASYFCRRSFHIIPEGFITHITAQVNHRHS